MSLHQRVFVLVSTLEHSTKWWLSAVPCCQPAADLVPRSSESWWPLVVSCLIQLRLSMNRNATTPTKYHGSKDGRDDGRKLQSKGKLVEMHHATAPKIPSANQSPATYFNCLHHGLSTFSFWTASVQDSKKSPCYKASKYVKRTPQFRISQKK